MLDGMPGFVRGDPRGTRPKAIVNVAREAKLFLGRIVMIAQKVVRLDHLNIVNLRRLQNLPRAFRAGDVGARAYLCSTVQTLLLTRNLRPNANNQRHANIEQPVTSAVSDVGRTYLS